MLEKELLNIVFMILENLFQNILENTICKVKDLVEIDSSKAKAEGIYLMQREISYVTGQYIRHNPDAIAASIIQLICDDLKFKDMQNDTKYVLLNDRLKQAKKSLKQNKKNDNFRKTKKQKPKGESKFARKYKERIESIQESEIKMKVKAGIPIEEKNVENEVEVKQNKEKEKQKLKSEKKQLEKESQKKKKEKQGQEEKKKKTDRGKHHK